MKHSLKKLAVLLGCGFCIGQMTVVTVLADTNESSSYLWSGFASEGETSVEDTATPRARGDVMNRGYIKLTNHEGEAGIYGETLGNSVIDEVGLELYLEQYDGSVFNSYKSWEFVNYDTYHNTQSFIEPVAHGYYYRLRGFHYAVDDDYYESASTMTNGLPI